MTKPRVLVDLRSDCGRLVEQLRERYDVINFAPGNPLAGAPSVLSSTSWTHAGQTYDLNEAALVEAHWPAVAGAVAFVRSLEPKPVAAVFWNTVLPQHAAASLACKEEGIPVYEINHNRLETPRVGHFETHSAADTLVGSDHATEHRCRNGCPANCVSWGQPAYDGFVAMGRDVARGRLGLPTNTAIILKTSVDINPYSPWYADTSYFNENEAVIWMGLAELQQRQPFQLVISSRHQRPQADMDRLGGLLYERGFKDGTIAFTSDEPIKELIAAADLVVCQRSGVQVDCVVMETPCLAYEGRPFTCYKEEALKGVSTARTPSDFGEFLVLFAKDRKFRENQIAYQKEWKEWWGATGNAGDRVVEDIACRA